MRMTRAEREHKFRNAKMSSSLEGLWDFISELMVDLNAADSDMQQIRAERDKLKAQRDGLLAALKNAEAALWAINSDHSEAQSADYHARAVRAAIAEAEQPKEES